MKRRLIVSVILVVTLALLSACGGGEEPEPQAATEAPAPAEEAEEAPAPAEEATETDIEEPQEAPPSEEQPENTTEQPENTTGETTELEVASGADYLDSYRIYYKMSFENASLDESMDPWTGDMVMDIIVDEASNMHFTMDMSGIDMGGITPPGDTGRSMEMYQLGESTYMLMDIGMEEPICTNMPGTEGMMDTPEPADIGGTIKAARLVKSGEEVNGIATDHYAIENIGEFLQDTEFSMDPSARADIWVAQEGGYLVRFITPPTTVSSASGEGTMAMELEMQDINQVDSIVLPDICENAEELNIPGMPDMEEVPETQP